MKRLRWLDDRRVATIAAICGAALVIVASVMVGTGPTRQGHALQCDSGLNWSSSYAGIGYDQHLYPQSEPNPGCTGDRELYYTFSTEAQNNIDEVRLDFSRVWVCGSLAFSNGEEHAYNWWRIAEYAGWTTSNSCGLQADMNSYWHEAGVFWDSRYMNY